MGAFNKHGAFVIIEAISAIAQEIRQLHTLASNGNAPSDYQRRVARLEKEHDRLWVQRKKEIAALSAGPIEKVIRETTPLRRYIPIAKTKQPRIRVRPTTGRPRRGQNRTEMKPTDKRWPAVLRLKANLLKGLPTGESARLAGMAESTASAWVKAWRDELPKNCACGRPRSHAGWCKHRLARHEKGKAAVERLSAMSHERSAKLNAAK